MEFGRFEASLDDQLCCLLCERNLKAKHSLRCTQRQLADLERRGAMTEMAKSLLRKEVDERVVRLAEECALSDKGRKEFK